jgi:hypothetical protein
MRRAISAGQNQALKEPVCTPRRRRGTSRMVNDPVPANIAAELGIFRRAGTRQDRLAGQRFRWVGSRVLARSIRIVKATDGTRFAMAISYGNTGFPGGPADEAACLKAMLHDALAQPQADNPQVRKEIDAILGAQIRRAQALINGTAHSLTVMTLDSHGHPVAVGATTLYGDKVPALGSIGTIGHGERRKVDVWGLIPDGIHDVRIIDSAGPKAQRVSPRVVPIRDNVYHAALPRKAGPRISVQWRTRNGHVVRTTHLVY